MQGHLEPGSRTRAFLIVAALSVGAGALLGLLTVGGALLVAMMTGRSVTPRDLALLTVFATGWGSLFGLALGPVVGFGLLRAVPLGRAIVATALGALLGVATTFVLAVNPFVSVPVGFVAGAVVVRFLQARMTRAQLPMSNGSD